MNFITFFLYFTISYFIFQSIVATLLFLKYNYNLRKLKNEVKTAELDQVTVDQILDDIHMSEGKKTWN